MNPQFTARGFAEGEMAQVVLAGKTLHRGMVAASDSASGGVSARLDDSWPDECGRGDTCSAGCRIITPFGE